MHTCSEVLGKAIQARQPAVVIACVNGSMHGLRVEFLAESDDPADPGFWAKVDEGDGQLVDHLVETGATVEVSFNTEDAKVFFDSAVLRKRRNYWLNRGILLRIPERVSVVERRKNNRESVPDDIEITAHIFRTGTSRVEACPTASRAWDLSLQGASLICPAHASFAAIQPGEPVNVAFRFDGAEVILSATHRYTQVLSTNSLRVGVQFNLQDPANQPVARDLENRLTELESLRIRRSFRTSLKSRHDSLMSEKH